jgi:diguanylate cyclase (GGDEF)-like protein/PAS domain S-box-containing protein
VHGVIEARPDFPDPPGLARRYPAWLACAAVAVLAYVAWLSTDIGTPYLRRVVSDMVFIVAPLLAATSTWTAHRRRRERHHGWAWICAGCVTWAVGGIIWAVYELGLDQVAPFPSFADLGFVLYAIPIAIGLTRFPTGTSTLWSRLRISLDTVVMTGCLLLTSAAWVLAPIVSSASGFTRIDALAYPLADVAIATAVLARSITFVRSRRVIWMTLAAGLLVEALTDSVYVSRVFSATFEPGHLLDVGWLLSFTLIAIAAQTPSPATALERAKVPEPPGLLGQLLPYLCIGVAAWSFVVRRSELQLHGFYTWFVVVLIIVAVARQVVVTADHAAVTRDLSAAVKRRTADLKRREQWWRDIVQNLSDVVMVIDREGEVQYCSPSVLGALGHWPRELHTTDGLRTQVHPDDVDAVLKRIVPVLTGAQQRGKVEARVRRADGSYAWFEITVVGQLTEKALQGAVLTLHDVTERHELTDRLAHQAYHDALTGLPNRAMLMQRIDEELLQGTGQFALVLIDLDDFKLINDSHGHASGDLVLEAIGERLRDTVRDGEVIGRLGGDEFAVLLHGSAEAVHQGAERVAEQIARPVVIAGRTFLVSSSIGVVWVDTPDENETSSTLFSHADIALYDAKVRDKGGIVFIQGAQREDAARQVHLREQIAQPRLDQFTLVYQPVVDLKTGIVRGVEALLRWTHPELGPISPVDFIPLAEHGGSIRKLGWHVINTAMEQLAEWQAYAPHHRLAIGINVSVSQLDEPLFAERVLEQIERHGLMPDQIVLELTEQALSRDFETAVSVVAELRAAGVSVAVDDYGTGYSSLRYLHRFDADVVKIDRSFIAKLEGSEHTQKIVRSVVDMAVSLDLQCIAEGIETPEQRRIVQELGCELGQGYLFAKPVLPAEIPALLDCDPARRQQTA